MDSIIPPKSKVRRRKTALTIPFIGNTPQKTPSFLRISKKSTTFASLNSQLSTNSMRTRLFLLLSLSLLLLCGCQKSSPSKPVTVASEFTACYAELYGQAYDSVPQDVLALDLYSEGLDLNEHGKIEGTGTNLYISDIFTDTTESPWVEINGRLTLRAGIDSVCFRSDSLPAAGTFLPGMDFEGNPTGIYLLSIADNAIAGIQVLDSGRFILRPSEGQNINFQGTFFYSTRSSANAKPVVQTYSARFNTEVRIKN